MRGSLCFLLDNLRSSCLSKWHSLSTLFGKDLDSALTYAFLGDFNFKRTFCGSHKDVLYIFFKELFKSLVGVLSSKKSRQ